MKSKSQQRRKRARVVGRFILDRINTLVIQAQVRAMSKDRAPKVSKYEPHQGARECARRRSVLGIEEPVAV
jgi:hypothetical protein